MQRQISYFSASSKWKVCGFCKTSVEFSCLKIVFLWLQTVNQTSRVVELFHPNQPWIPCDSFKVPWRCCQVCCLSSCAHLHKANYFCTCPLMDPRMSLLHWHFLFSKRNRMKQLESFPSQPPLEFDMSFGHIVSSYRIISLFSYDFPMTLFFNTSCWGFKEGQAVEMCPCTELHPSSGD